MEPKILVFGDGYLGNRFHKYFKKSNLSKKKIFSLLDAINEIAAHKPDWVINCIGKTGKPNVDWCEDNRAETAFSNVAVPIFIAQACKEQGASMLHVGSGCIYEGDNGGAGFSEEDLPNFNGSFYSRTKELSEFTLKSFNVLQIRIRMPFDNVPSGRNLLSKLLGYKKVVVERNSITVVEDMLKAAELLMDKKQSGVFNVVNTGAVTHKEILSMYEELSGIRLEKEYIDVKTLDKMTLARRSNCVLSNKKLEGMGIIMPRFQDSLLASIKHYIEQERKQ